jgi:hypothetical protein
MIKQMPTVDQINRAIAAASDSSLIVDAPVLMELFEASEVAKPLKPGFVAGVHIGLKLAEMMDRDNAVAEAAEPT